MDTSEVFFDKEHGTGLATITVDENAENAIVVIAGANTYLELWNKELSPVSFNTAFKPRRPFPVAIAI